MGLRLLSLVFFLAFQTVRCGPPPSAATFATLGKLCTPPGAEGNNPACDKGLYCPSSGAQKDHCVTVAPTPSTTIVGPTLPPTTTTTRPTPPHPTMTLPRPEPMVPVRFDPADVGLKFPASAEILWDPRTGLPSSQYEAMVRASTLDLVVLPDVLRLIRDVCPAQAGPGLAGSVRDLVGKFMVVYTLRPLRAGDPYFWHPNYLWDIPQNVLRRARDCVMADPGGNAGRPELTPAMLQLLDLSISRGQLVLGDDTFQPAAHDLEASHDNARDGALDPRLPQQPLTADQCTLLHASHEAHEQHAAELIRQLQLVGPPTPDDTDYLEQLAEAAGTTQLAFEGSALDVNQLTLFALIFTGKVDTRRPVDELVALTAETRAFHMAWMDALGCSTGEPPRLAEVWGAALGHARAHFLRAIFLPGLVLREVCPLYIGYCPVTGR